MQDLQQVMNRLAPHKGEFEVSWGVIRHKTARCSNGERCCPLAYLVLLEGLNERVMNTTEFAKRLGIGYSAESTIVDAADSDNHPFRKELEGALV